jgi:hypothetical protein
MSIREIRDSRSENQSAVGPTAPLLLKAGNLSSKYAKCVNLTLGVLLQRSYVYHKAVPHITLDQSLVCLINLLNGNQLDI